MSKLFHTNLPHRVCQLWQEFYSDSLGCRLPGFLITKTEKSFNLLIHQKKFKHIIAQFDGLFIFFILNEMTESKSGCVIGGHQTYPMRDFKVHH